MRRFSASGYTYFGMLFVVMLVGLALAGASAVWQVQQRRYKEQQLLYIGQQYMAAIAAYYNSGPGGFKQYPRKITDLLKDPRDPGIKRYLRKPWPDPLNVTGDWGLVRTSQGAIAGIYSKASGVPLKRAGFDNPALDRAFANRKSYAQWKFVYIDGSDGGAVPAGQDIGNTEAEKPADLNVMAN